MKRKELQEIKEQQVLKSLKETLSEMIDHTQVRCQQMKDKLFEVKEEKHNKASEIVKAVKQKGKEALNKVSVFFDVKKNLQSIRENVREGIVETDQTLTCIDGFGEGMRMANQQLVNSFRVLTGKEQVDYSKKETANISIVVMRKPWDGKKMYQNIVLHLDAAIDKVDNLAMDGERKQEGRGEEQPQVLSMVSEPEYEYGAEVFEAYVKESNVESVIAKAQKNLQINKAR